MGTHGQVCGLFPHVFRHHQHSERVRILTRLHSCSLGGKTALLDWQAAIAVTSRYARDAASGPLDKKTHFSHLNAPSLRVHQSRGLPARRAGIHFPPGQWRLPGGCSTEKPRGFPIPPTRALLRGRAAPRCSHRGVSRRWTGRWDRHTDREGCQACFRGHFPSPRGVDPRATVRHTWRDLASRRGTDLKIGATTAALLARPRPRSGSPRPFTALRNEIGPVRLARTDLTVRPTRFPPPPQVRAGTMTVRAFRLDELGGSRSRRAATSKRAAKLNRDLIESPSRRVGRTSKDGINGRRQGAGVGDRVIETSAVRDAKSPLLGILDDLGDRVSRPAPPNKSKPDGVASHHSKKKNGSSFNSADKTAPPWTPARSSGTGTSSRPSARGAERRRARLHQRRLKRRRS